MRCTTRVGLTVAVGTAVTLAVAFLPSPAAAHGRGGGGRGGHGVVVVGGGFYSPWLGYGFGPYWGLGWGWGPYPAAYYGPTGGVDMNYAMMAGYGAVELNVKPNRADVWVDGKYVGEARDLDGYPSYLWLADGGHTLAVYKGGYKTFEEQIGVQRGMKTTLKIRLEAGDSEPPGPKPGAGTDREKQPGKTNDAKPSGDDEGAARARDEKTPGDEPER
jgi:hypothetical protein